MMKVARGNSAQSGAVLLLFIGTLLAAWNWYLKPERAWAWAAALVLFVCMLIALRWAGAFAEGRRNAAREIQNAVVFAGLMMTITLGAKLAVGLGIWGDEDLARRGTMVLFGLFFVFTGNAMPKTLTPLTALRCDAAKVQAFQRLAGWTWVLMGLGYAMMWLLLPLDVARTASVALLASGALVIATQVVRLRRSRQNLA